jgi:tryptophanyl-tRNA synthetase
MSIVTDSKGLEDKKDPDTCNVFALYKLFANEEEIQQMRENYTGGNYGYGHAKLALFEKMWTTFEPMRKRRAELEADIGYVQKVLDENSKKARQEANEFLAKIRKAVCLR